MKISRNSKLSLLGLSLLLVLVLGIVVNMVTANTPTQGQEATPETTPSVETPAQVNTPEQVSVPPQRPPDVPFDFQSSCAMAIDDLGDDNPFTYEFSAVNVNNIIGYSWDFGHAPGGTGTGSPILHTFPTTGSPASYVVTLTCDVDPAYGSDIVLTGNISITPPNPLTFTLLPGQVVTSNGPALFTGNLNYDPLATYEWCITTTTLPPGTFNAINCVQNGTAISNTFNYSFGTYATTHYVHLKRTLGAQIDIASLSFLVNATAPTANFNLSATSGTDPLNITVTGTDALTGPITSYVFTVTSDNNPTACPAGICTTYTPATLTTPFNLNGLTSALYTIRLDYDGPGGSGYAVKTVLVYTAAPAVQAQFEIVYGDNVYSGPTLIGRRVCFNNTSGGPVANNYWDFDGDNVPDYGDLPAPIVSDTPEGGDPNAPTVCYVYGIGANVSVRLIVTASDPNTNSTDLQLVSVTEKPVAEFTWVPDPTEWGDNVNFTDGSTGTIDVYEWEFDYDNNGTIDDTSSVQNPNGYQFPLGVSRIRLTVRNTATGDFDTIEKLITVNRKEITCDIGGATVISVNSANPQNYTSVLGGLNGTNYGTRTATYEWLINGNPVGSSANLTGIDWNTYGFGTHNVTLNVITNDGAMCSRTISVVYDFAPIECLAIGVVWGGITTPPPVYPSNVPATFSVNLAPLEGTQTLVGYEWFINDVSQGAPAPGNTSLVINSHSVGLQEVRYVAYVDNDGDTIADVSCLEEQIYDFQDYPTPTCDFSGIPSGTIYADGANYQITVDAGNLAGRTITEIRLNGVAGAATITDSVTNPGGSSYTFTWTNHTDLTAPDWEFEAEIDIFDGVGNVTALCDSSVGMGGNVGQGVFVPVTTYNPICTIVNAGGLNAPNTNTNRVPIFGNMTAGQYNHAFNINFNHSAVSTVVVTARDWSYPVNSPNLPEVAGGGAGLNTSSTINWALSSASVGAGNLATIQVDMAVEYRDVNNNLLGTATLDCSRNVQVFVPAMTCSTPTGDITPLPNDDNSYGRVISHAGTMGAGGPVYGRPETTTWILERYIGGGSAAADLNDDVTPGLWQFVTQQVFNDGSTFDYNAFVADEEYRLRYEVVVTTPNDACDSRVLLVSETATVGFSCDLFYGNATNDFNVLTVNGGDVSVTVNVDNGNDLPLLFEYFLLDENGVRISPAIHSDTYALDGDFTTTIPRANFAYNGGNTLVGNYVMEVEVTSPPFTGANCPLTSPQRYVLGNIQAEYAVEGYGVDGNGITRYGFALNECFTVTNQSLTDLGTPTFGDAAADLLYEWIISGGGTPANNNYSLTTFAGYQPFQPAELCFGDNGTYSLQLRGYNIITGANPFYQQDLNSQNIRVCDPQSLSVNQTGLPFAGNNQTFTVSSLGEFNVPGNNYVFTVYDNATNVQVGTVQNSASNSLIRSFGAGTYRLEVTRNGCLGRAAISRVFTIQGASGISGSYNFVNNVNAGTAPLTVCFNDTSVSNPLPGNPIVFWEWDWEGDGTYDYSYNAYETPCNVYSAVGIYRPRLRVTNLNGQIGFAQNPVRVYNQLEGQMSFTASPQGGGSWCFTPNMSNAPVGTLITGWDFDTNDGNPTLTPPTTPPANGSGVICYTYGASGTYYVDMCFTDPSGTPPNDAGCVTVPVVVDLPGDNPPTLQVTPVCNADRNAQFTVRNLGPTAMPNTVTALFYNSLGVQFASQTVSALAVSGTQVFTFPNVSGPIRMVIGAYGVDVTAPCNYAPELTVSHVCAGGLPSFTLTNAANPNGINSMHTTQTYEIRNSANVLVNSGNLPVLGSGLSSAPIVALSSIIPGLDPYETYTITSTGVFTVPTTVGGPCHTPRPTLAVVRTCANPLVYTINATGTLVLPQTIEVVNTTTSAVVATGTVPVGTNTSVVITLTGLDPHRQYRVRVGTAPDNGFLVLNTLPAVCTRPNLQITHDCSTTISFTVTNTGGTMFTNAPISYTGPGGTSIAETFVNLAPTTSTTINVIGATDPYAAYTLNIGPDFNTNSVTVTGTRNCVNPVLVASNSACTAYPLTFTVNNTGGAMIIGQTYEVYNSALILIQSGTLTIGAGGNQVITLSSVINPYDETYTLTSNGFAGSVSGATSINCVTPGLSVAQTCADPLVLTINSTGPVVAPQSYEVIRTSDSTVVASGTIPTGGTPFPITLTGQDPYLEYRVRVTGSTNGFLTLDTTPAPCVRPVLAITHDCTMPMTFTVTNTGGAMLSPSAISLTTSPAGSGLSAPTIQVAGGGASVVITVTNGTGVDPYATYTFQIAGGFNTNATSTPISATRNCDDPALTVTNNACASYPLTFTVTNTGLGNMQVPQLYEIRNSLNVVVASGNISLAVGGSSVITMTGISPYDTYTFSSTGFAGTATGGLTNGCTTPVLAVSRVCAADLQITISATGTLMTPQGFNIVDTTTSTVVATTSLTAGVNPTTTVTLTGLDPHRAYQVVTNGSPNGFLTLNTIPATCTRPNLVISHDCSNSVVSFTVTNIGGDMFTSSVVNYTGPVGTDIAPVTSLLLVAGGSVVIPVNNATDPYAAYTLNVGTLTTDFNTNGVVLTDTRDCTDPNLVVSTNNCASYPLTFTITNNGGTMVTGETYEIRNSLNTVVASGLLSVQALPNPNTQVITLTGITPYETYTISMASGSIVSLTGDLDNGCAPTVLSASSVCSDPLVLTISSTNPVAAPQSYEVLQGGVPVTTGTIAPFSTPVNITLTGLDPYLPYQVRTTAVTNGFLTLDSTPAPCVRPILAITHDCLMPLTFTVTNTGGAMLSPSNVTLTTAPGGSVLSAPTIQLGAGGTTILTVSNVGGVDPYAAYTLQIGAGFNTNSVAVTGTRDCDNPVLVVTNNACASYPLTFTVTNTSATAPMQAVQAYEVRNSLNAVVASGNINLGAGAFQDIVLTGITPYDTYTFSSTGFAGTASGALVSNCLAPTLDVIRTCANPLVLTITSTQPIVAPFGYEVVLGATVIESGTVGAFGTPFVITLTAQDPYASYIVRTTGAPDGFVTLNTTPTPCARPDLVITHDCLMPVTFTVTNNGGAMLSPSDVVLVNGAGGSIAVSTVQLGAGGVVVIPVTPTVIDPYAVYTLQIGSVTDFNTNSVVLSETRDCDDPVLEVANNACATYPLTFTVTNTGGLMITGQAYQITNSASAVVLSGTLNIASGGNQVITMTGITPYDTYTINTGGFAGTFTAGSDVNSCGTPLLEAVSTCGYPATFTIRNIGGDMITSQSFTITHRDGTDVTPAVSSYDLNNGEELVITMPTDSDPYGLYTLVSTGFAGNITQAQNCTLPRLTVTSSCIFPVQFLVSNVGGDMLVDHTYRVSSSLGFDLMPETTYRLLAGEIMVVDVPVTDLTAVVSFLSDTYGILGTSQVTCTSGGGVTNNPVIDLGDPIAPTITPITADTLLLNRLSLDILDLPAWAGVPTCGHGCPIFRMYHTNQSGDWDIWRLDGADMETETTIHTNLTERDSADVEEVNAPDVTDLAPSLSPNNEWFVFSSNRDGNWEIYVAPTDGNLTYAQRVTYNEIAVDIHPTWGPSNYIVYESTRTGNWDLFMVDVVTGIEYQLTDSPSQEQNAAWSADGSKIAYQSDVDGTSQIYELDLLTMTVRRLSSEPIGAMEPTYSPDDNRMVYMAMGDNGNSIIKVMNLATTVAVNVTTVDENATIAVFSPSGRFLAYQSNADGDLDIYVHEFGTGLTRKLTDNTIDDFAPTWLCGDDRLVFTSEIDGNPNIYEVDVLPMDAPAILVEEDAFQLTFEDFLDVYPMMNSPFERASREEIIFIRDTQYPDGLIHRGFALTVEDTSIDAVIRDDWAEIDVCPASNFAIGGG